MTLSPDVKLGEWKDKPWTCTDDSDLPFPMPSDASDGLDAILQNPYPENPAFPAKQGLYDPENERDACGVGFVCHIRGVGNHKIVSDAKNLLCNMTHRGASECTFRQRAWGLRDS